MTPNATDDSLASSPASSSSPSSSSSNSSAKCNPAAAVSLRKQMLRESFDLINDHLEQSLPSSANHTSADDGYSASHGFVSSSSSSSSSSSPVPSSSTSTAESSTTSAESSDQEQDGADTASKHQNSTGNAKNSCAKNDSRKTDDLSSPRNDTDETDESSHADRQNISKDDDDSSNSSSGDSDGESSDDTGSGDESEDDAFLFADNVYIQTDEVTLSTKDLDRLRSLRPQGGATCSAAVTTMSKKRSRPSVEVPDQAPGKDIFDGNHVGFGKQPRLHGDIGQISSRQGQHQPTSSRNSSEISIGRRPSTSRSA